MPELSRSFRSGLMRLVVVGLSAIVATGCASLRTERDHHRDVDRDAAHDGLQSAIAQLDWLAGTWSGPQWGGEFIAFYSTPHGGRILSHSRLLTNGQEAFYEFEVFESRGDTVHLSPYPGGKRVDGFVMSLNDPSARKVVFENPDKDYPTRITYHRASDDTLRITLDDPHGGSTETEVFELKRK